MPTYELIQDGHQYATVEAKDIHEALGIARSNALHDNNPLLTESWPLSDDAFIEVGARNPKTGRTKWDMVTMCVDYDLDRRKSRNSLSPRPRRSRWLRRRGRSTYSH